nr:unnamed protein product [Digitaria exilis]
MRQELAEKIGIDAQQVKFWFQNRRTKIKLKARGNENKEIRKENAQLRAENMKLFQQLQCGKCRDVNPMDEKWRIANENARLMGMKQRAQGYLIKLINEAPLPHSEMLGHVASASLHQVPFIESISTKQAMLLAYAERALSEFMMLARNGEPLWQRCATGKMLNRQEYKRHTFPGLLGPCPEGFVIESSKETSFVRGRPYELVDIITDVSRWSKMFPGIIAGVRKSNVITSGPLTPQNGLLQESPQAPNRRMKFLRFSRQIEGMWAVVDVSPMDSMRGIEAEGNQIGYMGCRLLPSGCLLEDIDSTGFTKVTWIVHVEYNDTIVSPPFKSFFQSGQALGASRWLALLQRQCEYMSNQDSSYSSDMSDLGRRSVLDLAKRMMASFYTAMSKPFTLKQPSNNVRNWRGRCKIRADMFGVTSHLPWF